MHAVLLLLPKHWLPLMDGQLKPVHVGWATTKHPTMLRDSIFRLPVICITGPQTIIGIMAPKLLCGQAHRDLTISQLPIL